MTKFVIKNQTIKRNLCVNTKNAETEDIVSVGVFELVLVVSSV